MLSLLPLFLVITAVDDPEYLDREERSLTQSISSKSTLGDVVVIGNERTRLSVIRRELGLESGDMIDCRDLAVFEQRLFNLEVFSVVTMRCVSGSVPNAVALEVTVDERWTLVGVPVVASSDNGFRVGAFVLESNFLGTLSRVGAGGFYSPQGTQAFSIYQNPSFIAEKGLLELRARFFDGPKTRFDFDEELQAFDDQLFQVEALVGYAFGQSVFNQGLNFYVGAFVSDGSAGNVTGDVRDGVAVEPALTRDLQWGPLLTLRLDQQDFDIFAARGLRAEFTFGLAPDSLGSSRSLVRFDTLANYGIATSWGHAISLTGNLVIRDGDEFLDALQFGGAAGVRGFRDQGVWAERAVFGTVEYLVPMFDWGGTWALAGFADVGAFTWREEDVNYVNPGTGFRFFLRDVAFPAVGIDVTYNTVDDVVRASALIGFAP
ncbi:MAG: BamA/TamA family outer membrane protein [Myxococcota bacterium]